jgi:hypothetical protein
MSYRYSQFEPNIMEGRRIPLTMRAKNLQSEMAKLTLSQMGTHSKDLHDSNTL